MIVLYGKFEDDFPREIDLNNVKKIRPCIDGHGVLVDLTNGESIWYDHIEVVNYE